MQIIKAGLENLEDLVPLFDAYRVFYKKKSNRIAAGNFLKDRIEKEDSILFLAQNSLGKSVGFAQLYPLFSSTQMKRLWLLNDLFVAPSARGKGVSKLLLNECKSLVINTKACGLSLETEKNNLIGNALYLKTDFELDTEHNFYFWSNPN